MQDAICVFLFDESGIMAEPWEAAGFICYCVDTKHSIRRERVRGNIHFVWGDARSWIPPRGKRIVFMACFPPCTDVAGSGARDFKIKGTPLLCDALHLFNTSIQVCEYARCPYMVENPVGVLSSHVRKPDYMFDPCDYGDPYTKKTCLWTGGGFVMPEKRRVEPVLGSMMHTMTPGADRQRKRSETPRGFAQAVFEANHQAMLAMAS